MSVITKVTTYDFRFPTSATFSGSDAMNPDPDYSSAYVVIATDAGDSGNGFVFTIGRGNDVVVRAIDSMSETLIGRNVEELLDNMRLAWDLFVRDSQLRWLGPEKGVEHMAIGAVLSALWDLKAKRAGKPLWLLLSEMEPEELVATLDFRYLTDALTPQEALEILRAAQEGKAERIAHLKEVGYPGYSTAAGWLGYSDEKMVRLAKQETEVMGFKQIKLKVGQNLEDDLRRLKLAREAVGPDIAIAVDANEYLLAKKFGVKVCPHAGGVGLCEAISQLAMFDYVSVSGEMEDRVVEYVDNQHEYFVHPTVIKNGRYVAPLAPGNGTEMKLDECMKYLHKD